MERTYSEALHHAQQRLRTSRRPVGVAVRRCWFEGKDDGARASVVITNGINHCASEGSVLVPRVSEWVQTEAIEEALEARAMSYPHLTAMRNVAHEVDEGSIDLHLLLEQIWLTNRAA